MRNLLLILSFIFTTCLTTQAQSKQEQRELEEQAENDKKYFDDTDKDFDLTAVPEKWKNESAVILCQKLSFSYTKKQEGMTLVFSFMVEESVRKRVKLLDKSAVEEFSKFYFPNSAKIGIRIIKASGKTEKVDIRQAIAEN